MAGLTLTAPCHFGLEAVLKREVQDLGFEVRGTRDGRVSFACDDVSGVVRANIHLRSAKRVLWVLGEFEARTWDELFEGVRAIPWEDYIPVDGRFYVAKASSAKSRLFSPRDIQRIVKKAAVERLKVRYRLERFEETGEDYPLRVQILDDLVTVSLDTTGEALHKRGYRKPNVTAPIAENLAAGLLMLTPWRGDRILVDPFCGSGTFAIEAAMMAAGIPPGLSRHFSSERWGNLISREVWKRVRRQGFEGIDMSVETDIQGFDSDPRSVEIARGCAREAGVEELVHFQQRDVSELSHRKKYGFIVTNPPYGARLGGDDEALLREAYRLLGERYRALDSWSLYVITSFKDAEKAIGGRADRNRKIYNGMIETRFLQYIGAKPPKRHG